MLIKFYNDVDNDDVCVSEHKSIKIHNINSRIDKSKEFVGNNEFGKNRIMYNKQSSFCNMLDENHLAVKDDISITIDKDTGNLVKYGSIVSWPFGIYPSSYQFGDIDNSIFNVKKLNDFNGYKIFNNSLVEDNTCLYNITTCFEDEFQLRYLPVAGMLLSFFSTIVLDYPYMAQFVFDNKLGFNIMNIYTNDLYKSLVENRILTYRPLIADLFVDFKEECDKENRSIRAYIQLHEWGVVVRIVDQDYDMTMNYHLNLSDNCRILQANELHNSKEYGSSNLLNTLLKLGVPTVLDTLGSISYEGENCD